MPQRRAAAGERIVRIVVVPLVLLILLAGSALALVVLLGRLAAGTSTAADLLPVLGLGLLWLLFLNFTELLN